MAVICEDYEKNILVKDENLNGVCQGCLEEDNLKDMNSTYYDDDGKPEVYTDMMTFCFAIKVGEYNKDFSMVQNLICDVCIGKLRDVARFRAQIETSQYNLKQLFEEKSLVIANNELSEYEETNSVSSDQIIDVALIKREKNKKRSRKKIVTKNELNITDSGNSKIPFKLKKSELKCRICGESFHVHKSLVIHMSLHFPNLICEKCGRTFATRSQLRNHQATHVKERKACAICMRKFKSSGSLRAHIRAHTGDNNRYRCPICLERFSTYSCRRKHMVQLHGEELRRYACKQCPKRFSLPTNLSAHVRNVHLRERKHICQQCGTGFFVKRGLESHMLSHTGERNYKCNVCFKSYGRKYTLDEHMKIHNNERQHACTVCGKAFTQKVTLKGHMQLHVKEKLLIVDKSSS